MSEPNQVVQSSREVIEGKLLLALDDPATVAILADKDDLDLLITALGLLGPRGIEETCALKT